MPIDKESGEVLLEEQEISSGIIIGGLYTALNWETQILFECKQPCKIEIHQPLKACDINIIELNNISFKEGGFIDVFNNIKTDHLNSEEEKSLKKVISAYKDIIYQEGEDLSFSNQIKHEIKTSDEIPVYSKSYRYPYVHKAEIQDQISKMLKQNIIRPSYSPWSSPIWIVPKKADASGKRKWRLVVDYRKLNDKTIDDRYPLPNITEILDKLGRCMYFTTLDLASGFHQVEVARQDIKKTAFNVENGHYEFTRMPFGLKNAPATFQRVMDNVLQELQNKICLVYMDDIIVYSTSLIEHTQNLKQVFDALRKANLKIQMDKSQFFKKEVTFLGHIVTQQGIKPNPEKIAAVQRFSIPKTPKQIKEFLGILGYYRKFIKDFSKLTKPMTSKLKKNEKIDINDPKYVECFNICKDILTTEPILAYPDFSKQFILTTDASKYAIGAVLSQIQNGSEHPICYASRTLNDHEINYSTIEQELLAIVFGTKYFRPYLFGRKFKIVTDHKPLNWIMSLKEPNSKLVRWRLKLEEFDYTIEHKAGKMNGNADALSRLPVEINLNERSNPSVSDDTAHSAESDSLDLIPISTSTLNKFKFQFIFNLIPSGSASIKTDKIFNNTRKTLKLKNPDEETLVSIMKNHLNPKAVNAINVENTELFLKIQDIYRTHFSRNKAFKIVRCTKIVKDIVDELEQDSIIKNYHTQSNHRGITESYEHLKRTIFFPNLKVKITLNINQCDICQTEKYERSPEKIKFELTETPKQPLDIVHIDIFFMQKGNPILTIIDKFSRYAQAYELESRNTPHIKEQLMKYFSTFGKPKLIVSDQEKAITTIEIKDYLDSNNIKIHFTSANSSNSNSPVERFHSTLIEHLRIILNNEKVTCREALLRSIHAYNNSIHNMTKFTPFELFFGRKSDDPTKADLNEIQDKRINLQNIAFQNSLKKKKKYITKLNKHRHEPNNSLPNEVFLRKKTVKKLDARNKKIKILHKDRLHVYNHNNVKLHKKNINKVRKKTLQDNGVLSRRDHGYDEQPGSVGDQNQQSTHN